MRSQPLPRATPGTGQLHGELSQFAKRAGGNLVSRASAQELDLLRLGRWVRAESEGQGKVGVNPSPQDLKLPGARSGCCVLC